MLPRLVAAAAFAFGLGIAVPVIVHSQDTLFRPGANPVSNQPWDEAVITVGTAFPVTRAIYNGNATACNITVTTNAGHSVQHQNVQPGEYLIGQFTLVGSSTCSAGVLIAEF